jgi:V/A-type H+-transporting ATPase subunit K
MHARNRITGVLVLGAAFMAGLGSLMLWLPNALAEQAPEAALAVVIAPEVLKWAYIAAALATGASSIGAAYAVATVGSAAVGALTEKPELFGRMIILVGLAEGIAIYGLIVSILILNSVA